MSLFIRVKRIYEAPAEEDGERILVDRLWPRGLTRAATSLAGWFRDLAPSPGLRQWFGHDPSRWAEFQQRYDAELAAADKQPQLQDLMSKAARGTVTLLFAARDAEHNSAVVLKNYVAKRWQHNSALGESLAPLEAQSGITSGKDPTLIFNQP